MSPTTLQACREARKAELIEIALRNTAAAVDLTNWVTHRISRLGVEAEVVDGVVPLDGTWRFVKMAYDGPELGLTRTCPLCGATIFSYPIRSAADIGAVLEGDHERPHGCKSECEQSLLDQRVATIRGYGLQEAATAALDMVIALHCTMLLLAGGGE